MTMMKPLLSRWPTLPLACWGLAMLLALTACGGGSSSPAGTPGGTTPTPEVPPVVTPVIRPPLIGALAWPLALDATHPAQMKLLATDPEGGAITWSVVCGPRLKCKLEGDSLSLEVDAAAPIGQSGVQITATNSKGLRDQVERNVIVWSRAMSGRLGSLAGAPDRAGLHLLILGDGFTAAEQPVFHQAAYELLMKFNTQPEIAAHLDAWNIHVGNVDAAVSGIPRVGVLNVVAPPLGSVLGCQNTARLLCPNSALALQVAAQLLPHYTMVLVIGNTPDYAGAGGVVSTVSLAPSARDIAVHELGHSFAGLADEYVDEYINYAYVEGAYPNITTFSAREQVPWRVWIDAQTPVPTSLPPPEAPDAVGLFYGGYYRAAGYFRPTLDSFMRNLGKNFGAVNGEAWARSVYAQGGAWSTSAPDTKAPLLRTAQPAEGWLFKATPLMGRKIAETRWYVGDTELTDQRGATQLPLFSAIPVVVRVDLVDLTGRVRLNQGVVASLSWSIQ